NRVVKSAAAQLPLRVLAELPAPRRLKAIFELRKMGRRGCGVCAFELVEASEPRASLVPCSDVLFYGSLLPVVRRDRLACLLCFIVERHRLDGCRRHGVLAAACRWSRRRLRYLRQRGCGRRRDGL